MDDKCNDLLRELEELLIKVNEDYQWYLKGDRNLDEKKRNLDELELLLNSVYGDYGRVFDKKKTPLEKLRRVYDCEKG